LELGRALGEVEEEDEVKRKRRGEDGVATEEIDLDLHRIAEPTEDIDIVPSLFVITARRVIVNADLVVNVLVEIRVKLGLKDEIEHAELRFFLGLEGFGIIEDF